MLVPLGNRFVSSPEDDDLFRIVANARTGSPETRRVVQSALLEERSRALARRVVGAGSSSPATLRAHIPRG
ncbi:hypothetical protein EXIGLDRAFT_778720 [Exidia glandulosa HHB12029]|uniref:Uncharacterized protein n=1 Tax=Exidia glandulosa HHB12029 TaxID=1314781 RepID=A0A165CEE2_EXIGL|nr:hypothetical protein EXIGLDRAFT_778720 [Exidia glandulosa HHB12029]